MLVSNASLSPSVILASAVAMALVSLLVILLWGATFLASAGIINGGRGVLDGASIFAPAGISFGVPTNAGAGNLGLSGTKSSACKFVVARIPALIINRI